ncbi:hypothetical protein [Streptomyces sp. NPDC001135]
MLEKLMALDEAVKSVLDADAADGIVDPRPGRGVVSRRSARVTDQAGAVEMCRRETNSVTPYGSFVGIPGSAPNSPHLLGFMTPPHGWFCAERRRPRSAA